MVGETWWSVGITLKYHKFNSGKWSARAVFSDDGYMNENSTALSLGTCHATTLGNAIDTVILDAKKLGVEFRSLTEGKGPVLFAYGDGECDVWPMPDGYQDLLKRQADRIGWEVL